MGCFCCVTMSLYFDYVYFAENVPFVIIYLVEILRVYFFFGKLFLLLKIVNN